MSDRERNLSNVADPHEHSFWLRPGGSYECACGKSRRPFEPTGSSPQEESMADDRTCYAGDLTTDQLGKVIRFSPEPGLVIEDTLVAVKYQTGEPAPSVVVVVKRVMPKLAFGDGWSLGHTSLVTVVSR